MTARSPLPETDRAEKVEIVALLRPQKRREDFGCRHQPAQTPHPHAPGAAGLRRHGNRPSTELAFLVDDGVTFPPDVGHAGRQRLPVRNRIEYTATHRRLAERTGELGRIQL